MDTEVLSQLTELRAAVEELRTMLVEIHQPKRSVRIAEAAATLGLTLETAKLMLRRGEFPVKPISVKTERGAHWRWLVSDLQKYISENNG